MQALAGSSERETAVAMSPSARLHAAQRALSERAMTAWGIANVFIILAQMFFVPAANSFGVESGSLNKFFMFSIAGWIVVVLLRRAAPLRVPAPMIFLVLVQIWFTVSTMVAQVQLGSSHEFIVTDYSLIAFFLCFLQGAMLAYFVPWIRKLVAKVLVGICSSSILRQPSISATGSSLSRTLRTGPARAGFGPSGSFRISTPR